MTIQQLTKEECATPKTVTASRNGPRVIEIVLLGVVTFALSMLMHHAFTWLILQF
jgi:hypothetical protein